MALLHCHPASSNVHSSTKPCLRREFFCSRGLKEGILFGDVENRVFRSTYRATHYLIASIARVSPPPICPAHSPPEAEKNAHSEKGIDAPEGSVLLSEDVGCEVRQDSSCRGYSNVQTSNGSIDSPPELRECHGFDSYDLLMSSPPGASSLHSSRSLSTVHATPLSKRSSSGLVIDIPSTSVLHDPYVEIKNSYRVSEFSVEQPEAPPTPDLQPELQICDCEGLHIGDVQCHSCVEQPEAPPTPDLQPELKIWDCEGLHIGDVQCHFCAVSKVGSDDDDGDSLILEENELMPVCRSTCRNAQQTEVVCTDDDSATGPIYAPFDCQEGANFNCNLQMLDFKARKWSRVVSDYLDIFSLGICETTLRQKPLFQAWPTSKLMLTLQKLVRSLKKGKSAGNAALFGEQLIILLHICSQGYKARYQLAQGRKARAARSFSRRFICKQDLVEENAHARDGRYKKVNMQILVQHCRKRYLRGRKNVPPKHLLVNCAIQGVEQAGQSVDTDSVSRFSHLLEGRDEGLVSCTDLSSEMLNEFQELPKGWQGSLEHKDAFASDKSSHIVSLKISSGSSSKPFNLLEIGDSDLTNLTEGSPGKMDEPIDGLNKESSGFPPWRSVNRVDDRSSFPTDQENECLDTGFCHSQHDKPCSKHDLTPDMRLLEFVGKENPSESADSYIDSLVEEGSQMFVLHVNGDDKGVSCFPVSGPHNSHTPSQPIASLSSNIEKELGIFMPYTRVHERHNKARLEHFAEGFLLRRHIMRQQQRAQLAPPFPPRDSAGYVCNYQGPRGKALGEVKANPHTLCSTKASTENDIEPGMTLTFSAKPQDGALSFGDHDCLVGADVVIDIVGLMNYIESQCCRVQTFTDVPSNLTNYTGMPLIGGEIVGSNFSAVIVTIIAIVVYTRTLLEGGLTWVGARTQKEESN